MKKNIWFSIKLTWAITRYEEKTGVNTFCNKIMDIARYEKKNASSYIHYMGDNTFCNKIGSSSYWNKTYLPLARFDKKADI